MKYRITWLLFFAALAVIGFFVFSPLPIFAHRIGDADRIVITEQSYPVSITITGADVAKVVRMIASGRRDTKHYMCIFNVRANFFSGTNSLGQIQACSQLFKVSGRQYRDETGVLDTLVATPILEARRAWENQQQQEPK